MADLLSGNDALQQALADCLQVFNAPLQQLEELRSENGTDPFAWTSVRWQMQGLQDSLGVHLAVLLALAALATILSLLTLAIQYRSRNAEPRVFWLFRKHYHTQSRIPYIVPHPVNLAVVATFLTSSLLLVYFAFTYQAWASRMNARAIRVASWFPVVWLPFFAAIWISGFGSMYLTYLAPAQYTRRGSLTGMKRRISPLLVNALCLVIPVLAIVTILPLQVYQATYMQLAMHKTAMLTKTLDNLSAAWTASGGQLDQQGIQFLLEEAMQAKAAVKRWRTFWAGYLGLWSFLTILAMGVAAPLCTSLVLSMHRRIRRMAANQDQHNFLAGDNTFPRYSDSSSDLSKRPITISIAPLELDTTLANYPAPLDIDNKYLNFASYTPTPSTPNSTPQTPAAKSFASQPFFSGSSNAKLVNTLDTWPKNSPNTPTSSRPSIHKLRRISHYAIFPGTSTALDPQNRADLQELNKRYWHVAAQYLTIFCIMAVICAFALFEASSDLAILTDCKRTNIAVLVVSYIFCILVNLWLGMTIKRLLSQKASTTLDSPESTIAAGSSRSRSTSHQDGLSAYTSDKLGGDAFRSGDVIQLRKPSVSGVAPMTPTAGLRIEIDGDNHNYAMSRPAYDTNRRRSSCRGPSMDLTEVLNLP